MFEKRKKWLKLTFWHPLKPHRFSWVVLIIILIGLLVLHEKFNLIDKFGIETSTYYFIAGIFITFIISIYVFYYTQEETKRLEYADALKKLVIEIGKNKQRFDEFESNVNMRCKEFEENKIWKWMPKQNSFTNWADGQNFQYKYFATNAYFHFCESRAYFKHQIFRNPQGQYWKYI